MAIHTHAKTPRFTHEIAFALDRAGAVDVHIYAGHLSGQEIFVHSGHDDLRARVVVGADEDVTTIIQEETVGDLDRIIFENAVPHVVASATFALLTAVEEISEYDE